MKIIDSLACVSTTLPETALDETGYFFTITRAFAWEEIPIIEIVSTLNELNFIIKEKDTPKAFIILKETIKNEQ